MKKNCQGDNSDKYDNDATEAGGSSLGSSVGQAQCQP